jgi:hypothetical protein
VKREEWEGLRGFVWVFLVRESGMMTNPDVAKKGSKLEGAAGFLNTRTLLPDERRKAAAVQFPSANFRDFGVASVVSALLPAFERP